MGIISSPHEGVIKRQYFARVYAGDATCHDPDEVTPWQTLCVRPITYMVTKRQCWTVSPIFMSSAQLVSGAWRCPGCIQVRLDYATTKKAGPWPVRFHILSADISPLSPSYLSKQIMDYLNVKNNGLLPQLQSAYQPGHSTKCARVRPFGWLRHTLRVHAKF